MCFVTFPSFSKILPSLSTVPAVSPQKDATKIAAKKENDIVRANVKTNELQTRYTERHTRVTDNKGD